MKLQKNRYSDDAFNKLSIPKVQISSSPPTFPFQRQPVRILLVSGSPGKEVHATQLLGQVLLLHRRAEGRVILVAFSVAQVLHESGGGVAQVEWNWGQWATVVPHAGLHIRVGFIDFH